MIHLLRHNKPQYATINHNKAGRKEAGSALQKVVYIFTGVHTHSWEVLRGLLGYPHITPQPIETENWISEPIRNEGLGHVGGG